MFGNPALAIYFLSVGGGFGQQSETHGLPRCRFNLGPIGFGTRFWWPAPADRNQSDSGGASTPEKEGAKGRAAAEQPRCTAVFWGAHCSVIRSCRLLPTAALGLLEGMGSRGTLYTSTLGKLDSRHCAYGEAASRLPPAADR